MPAPHFTFISLDSVDSTNNYAMAKVHEGMTKHGNGYFTGNQTSGKGQRGRDWQTIPGMNIALSIVLEPSTLKTGNHFGLSVAVALGCFDFFSHYAGDETKIKWPNDIYWRDRKAGGILIENVIRGNDWKWAIAGIGININQASFDENLKNPVSLKQITGKNFNITELAQELHERVMKRVSAINDGLLYEYNDLLFGKNEKVKLKQDNRLFEAEIKGVDNNGLLITFSATEQRFAVGEIEWIV